MQMGVFFVKELKLIGYDLFIDHALLEGVEPEVRVLGLSIVSNGRPDIVIPLPLPPKPKSHLFTLKEGSTYNIKLTFSVHRNIVSGLTYVHTVWKNGFRGIVHNNNTKSFMLLTMETLSRPFVVSGFLFLEKRLPVDNTKVMLGTFGPQSEPYTYVLEEETTPSGILARGSYTSRTRVRRT